MEAEQGKLQERIISREQFNNEIADEAAQSCVDWSDPERRKEALRYIVRQIWSEAVQAEYEQAREEAAKIADECRAKEEAMTLLREALERCRDWNRRCGNWSSNMEQVVDAALATQWPAEPQAVPGPAEPECGCERDRCFGPLSGYSCRAQNEASTPSYEIAEEILAAAPSPEFKKQISCEPKETESLIPDGNRL